MNELDSLLRQRFYEVNPNPNSAKLYGDEVYFIISREDAVALLGCSRSKFIDWVKQGVIRRAHVAGITGMYCRADVEVLLNVTDFLREHTARWLRYRNGSGYLDKFIPAFYHRPDGEPLSEAAIIDLEAGAASAFAAGMLDSSYVFRRLVRSHIKYPGAPKDDVEWLYLTDSNPPKLTTALQMRRWNLEANTDTEYKINRITLPPPSAMGKPTHRNVLKFLVQAASDLYGIEFDAIPDKTYSEIECSDRALPGDSENDVYSIYDMLTGVRLPIMDSITIALKEYSETYASGVYNLSLVHAIPLWYCAYETLLDKKKFQLSGHTIYLNDMLAELTGKHTRGANEEELAYLKTLRNSLRRQVGAHKAWSRLYTKRTPPLYIGCVPHRVLATWRKRSAPPYEYLRPHGTINWTEVPANAGHLAAVNKSWGHPDDSLQAVVSTLMEFHQKVIAILPEAKRFGALKVFSIKLITSLEKRGIDVESIYLYPMRDAEKLYPLTTDNRLDAVLSEVSN